MGFFSNLGSIFPSVGSHDSKSKKKEDALFKDFDATVDKLKNFDLEGPVDESIEPPTASSPLRKGKAQK